MVVIFKFSGGIMIKSLTLRALLFTVAIFSLLQQQTSHSVTKQALSVYIKSNRQSWSHVISSPWILAWAGINSLCAIGCNSSYKQEQANLKAYNIIKQALYPAPSPSLKQQLLELEEIRSRQDKARAQNANKSELVWADRYDKARACNWNVDKASLITESNQVIEKLKKAVQNGKTKYASLLQLYKDVSTALKNPSIQTPLADQFKLRFQIEIAKINQEMKLKAHNDKHKQIKVSLTHLLESLYVFDMASNLPAAIAKKQNELQEKIAIAKKSQQRLWIIPVVANGLMAMAYGIKYYWGSK